MRTWIDNNKYTLVFLVMATSILGPLGAPLSVVGIILDQRFSRRNAVRHPTFSGVQRESVHVGLPLVPSKYFWPPIIFEIAALFYGGFLLMFKNSPIIVTYIDICNSYVDWIGNYFPAIDQISLQMRRSEYSEYIKVVQNIYAADLTLFLIFFVYIMTMLSHYRDHLLTISKLSRGGKDGVKARMYGLFFLFLTIFIFSVWIFVDTVPERTAIPMLDRYGLFYFIVTPTAVPQIILFTIGYLAVFVVWAFDSRAQHRLGT